MSNLDANLREEMRFEVRRLHDEYRYTTVYVTHDQSEAMTTADMIAVMNHGKIEQAGSPEDIYDRPRSEFVARFIGSSNVIKGTALDANHISFCRRAAALRRRQARAGARPPRSRSASTTSGSVRSEPQASGERSAGDGGAAGLSRRQPRLSGRDRRTATQLRVVTSPVDNVRAGRLGLAAPAARPLPGCSERLRTQKTSENNNSNSDGW